MEAMKKMLDYMTTKEVASLWGCCEDAVRALIRRGRIPFEELGGRYLIQGEYARQNIERKNPVGRPRTKRTFWESQKQ